MAENNSTEEKQHHTFWYYLYMLHLYNSKAEALFKAGVISVSWVGGFWSEVSATAYYLFSIAIIMEYVVQLVTAEKFVPKILPLILILNNVVVFLTATGQLLSQKKDAYSFQYVLEIITMIVIWVDMLTMVLIEQPDECKIETSLNR